MIQKIFSKYYPHLIAVLIFFVIAFIYMSPAIEGKLIVQGDVIKAKGQQAEIGKYIKETGDYTLWTNSMFSGMPVYQIAMIGIPNYNVFSYMASFIRLHLPTYSVDVLFLYLIGFYILLLSFRISPWLSIVGAIAFALSSYNLIYIEAGHVNKALAISVMPPALAGIILIFNRKYLLGGILFCLFLGIQLAFNHVQITYYLFLIILVIGIIELIYSLREKTVKHIIISSIIILVATAFSILPNMTTILTTYEYTKESQRGGSELVKENENTNKKKEGLDIQYATAWSNGKAETFTVLIPNFKGGASYGELPVSSNLYNKMIRNGVPKTQAKKYIEQVPTYWGGKSITSGPFYYGAIICFLFVLGLFLTKGRLRWWIVIISVFAILWSWGENFIGFYSLFFRYFPLFNKFRVPETFLVITSLTFPLLAILALKQIFDEGIDIKLKKKYLLRAFYIVGGITLFLALFGKGLFDFVSLYDEQLKLQQMPDWFIEALRDDRAQLLKRDAFRSFVFIALATGLLWFFLANKLNRKYAIAIIGLLILIDLWSVDKRFLNSDDFKSKKVARQVVPTQADLEIMKDPDPHYRVFNLTQSPFQETHTSNFHKSLGGYHAAKLARYQDIIEHHLSRQNMNVINMLNTKYLIVPDRKSGQPKQYYNQDACGNAWFVDTIEFVNNPNEEIDALTNFNPKHKSIVDKKYKSYFENFQLPDSLSNATIKLTDYKPDELTYISNNTSDGFAVFSEIYYNDNKGWKAYIDDIHVSHIRVNYVLRGLHIPAGEHKIVFKFEPQTFYKAQRLSLTSSIIITVFLLISVVYYFWKRSKTTVPDDVE